MNNNSLETGTIFITGIPASGKSTLGKNLQDALLKVGIDNVKLLDGEVIRGELVKQGKRYGYSTDERNKVALEIAHAAQRYNKKSVISIICAICHVKETREEMRKIIGNVMEVYLECPVRICAKRDYKGHYAKAFQGAYDNFVGVTEPYQKSDHVELVLYTGNDSIAKCSRQLLESVLVFLEHSEEKEIAA
ncbi:MAG: adenylyl-sulfate kinase [Candidatus Omnitrophota bacterium]|nr:MAG: adenylyl-sulfate kinase [Candidatus Omnitrophota bacterium]